MKIPYSDFLTINDNFTKQKNEIRELLNTISNKSCLSDLQKVEELFRAYQDNTERYWDYFDQFFEDETELKIFRWKIFFSQNQKEEDFSRIFRCIDRISDSLSEMAQEDPFEAQLTHDVIIGQYAPHIYQVYCKNQLDLSNYKKVIDNALKILEFKDTYEDAFISQTYKYLADAYFNNGEYNRAAESYNNAILKNPEDIENYFKIAYFFFKIKDFNKAKDFYIKTLELANKYSHKQYHISTYCNLANTIIMIKQDEATFNSALEYISIAKKLNNDELNNLEVIFATEAFIHKEKGDFQKSFEIYKKLSDIKCDDGTYKIFKGICAAKSGKDGWKGDIKNGISLQLKNVTKNNSIPSSLYIYRPINERTISALVSNYIAFSNPKVFNDPLDSKYYIDTTNEDYLKLALDEIKIRSFAKGEESEKTPGIYHPLNTLMWAHYAENHKGISVEYEFKENLKTLINNDLYFSSVKYDNKLVHNMDIINFEDYAKCFFTKDKLWQYENEYRLVTFQDKLKEKFKLENHLNLKSITFGFKASQDSKEMLYKIINNQYPDCIFYEIKIPNLALNPFKLEREIYKI